MQPAPSNLYQLLKATAETSTAGITVYLPGKAIGSGLRTTYSNLFQQAKRNARQIHQIDGITSKSIIFLHFDCHSDNILWLWTVIAAGYLPAISGPLVNDLDQRRKHLLHVHTLLESPIILTTTRLVTDFLGLEQLNICPVETLQLRDGSETVFEKIASLKKRDDPALLMFTSGSTGNAKAVCLTHGQLLTSLEGKRAFNDTSSEDVFLNWIGMDHVASLCEIHLHAMSCGAEQVQVQATDILTEPLSFLGLIDKHRVTCSFAPNFFLAALRRRLDADDHPSEYRDLNLSCLRILQTGGEAAVVETCAALTEQLQRYRVAKDVPVVRPGFGMTETCAGSIYGKMCPFYDLKHNFEFASLGTCMPGINMRVIADDGTGAATVNEIGNLQISGPVVFTKYFNNIQATIDAFTRDKWFITQDRALIDTNGNLHLVGRTKESIIINGVKYSSYELETAIEETLIPGILPSYTTVFPYRLKGSETETFCVVYLPAYNLQDTKARVETSDAINKVSGMICGGRPHEIIPLEKSHLPKTSLGKISRAKVRAAYENGVFQAIQMANLRSIKTYRTGLAQQERPLTGMEDMILMAFVKRFDLNADEVGVNDSIFDHGITSMSLISLKQELQKKLMMDEDIPLITILANPTIRGLAIALGKRSTPSLYNPLVVLQPQGSRTPLWLVHPGVGEILVFLGLSKYITDRPVYALRARGFDNGESFFTSITEVVSTYHQRIKATQPNGPYAIAGYSFGAILAFEISKVLESHGDEVRFLGSFNLPPHIKTRMKQLDWIEALLNLSYFLDLITEEYARKVSATMHVIADHDTVLDSVIQAASPHRLDELSLDRAKLARWTSLAHAMQEAATEYEPTGSVASIDVFIATPLAAIAKSKDDWFQNDLCKWKDFTRSSPRFHDVDGAHYTMMGPDNVHSLQKKLKRVLHDRGL